MTDDDITKPERLIEPTPPTLLEAAVAYARALAALKIRETSRNSGPDIDRWLAQVNERPGAPWCAAALFEVFRYASRACGVPNPCPKSSGALRMYALADEHFKVGAGVVAANPSLLTPGMAFFEDHEGDLRDGRGRGHCGLVLGWTDPKIANLVRVANGNVAPADSRSREGTDFAIQDRPLSKMLAFLNFSLVRPAT